MLAKRPLQASDTLNKFDVLVTVAGGVPPTTWAPGKMRTPSTTGSRLLRAR